MVKQIVERIRNKDQRAMSELYQMYIGELSSVCYRYIPNADDAKDVLQNSFVKIFTAIPTLDYRGDEAFKGWLFRVVAVPKDEEETTICRARRDQTATNRHRRRVASYRRDLTRPAAPTDQRASRWL